MLVRKLEAQASHIIKQYQKEYAGLTDPELSQLSVSIKQTLDEQAQDCPVPTTLKARASKVLPQAFGLVREVAYRALGYRHHQEQLMAGIALYQGYLTQMQTGEGKTLALTAPAYLAALSGQKVHVVTANDYLARRDGETMGGLYTRLGLSCAVITSQEQFIFTSSLSSPKSSPAQLRRCTRKEAHSAAIIYGTASAFGFDYLRDQLVYRQEDLVGSDLGQAFAILDEVDNILLDEARTPLVISRPSQVDISQYYSAMALVRRLIPAHDYEVNKDRQRINLTEDGINKLEKWLNFNLLTSKASSLYSDSGSEELFYLENCLKALVLYRRDDDYLVTYTADKLQSSLATIPNKNTYPKNDKNIESSQAHLPKSNKNKNRRAGEIVLIDRVTGRPLPGRRFGSGLHEALEAKEGLIVKPPAQTVATISLQALFKHYEKLAGLSGTLETDKDVLYRLYGLETVVIPTHRPIQRIEAQPLVFRTYQKAIYFLIRAAIKVRESGAPVLIGTPSVGVSEEVSDYLKKQGIPHQLLNARQTETEARVIARAGYPGRITVATNMAGRGTDIIPGGRYADHLNDLARERGLVKEADAGTLEWRRLEEEAQARHLRAKEIVCRAGGLHVLGLGLQTSRRLDRQLAGRTGRQGNPGYSQFFYSLEDDLVKRYARDNQVYQRFLVRRAAQSETNIEYEDEQKVSDELNSILALKLIEECQRRAEGQLLDGLSQAIEFDSIVNQQREIFYTDRQAFLFAFSEELKSKVLQLAYAAEKISQPEQAVQLGKLYWVAERQLGQTKLATWLREATLSRLDLAWLEYLTALEELRRGIGLRAYGGQKPIQSYQLEAHRLWNAFELETSKQIIQVVLKRLTIR